MNKRLNILTHVLGSFTFLFLAFLISPDWPNLAKMLGNPFGFDDAIFQVEMLLFFYLNFYFLIDKFYFSKQYILYFGIVLVFLILFIPVTDFLIMNNFPQPEHHGFPGRHHHKNMLGGIFFSHKFYLFLLITAVSLLMKIVGHLKQIKDEKINTELSFLKAQINPHFLFNTLNSIYSLSLQKSEATPDAIVKLSNMMRYVLKETDQNYVPLKYELEHISNFVELQKLRLDSAVKLIFEMKGEFAGQKIAPLVLIPYIENAFKYGVNAEEESTIQIRINCSDNFLELHIQNTKVNTTMAALPSTKLGLINAKKRLNLLYPQAHILHIVDTKSEFEVDLKLYLSD